jgi:hypothetical protein
MPKMRGSMRLTSGTATVSAATGIAAIIARSICAICATGWARPFVARLDGERRGWGRDGA